jgi:peptide/nickel transport system ATP-binding protein
MSVADTILAPVDLSGPAQPLLEALGLTKHFAVSGAFFSRRPSVLRAVDDVTFSIDKGEVLGIVGEAGCGKSTTAWMLIGLIAPTRQRLAGRRIGRLSASCGNRAGACRWCSRTATRRSIPV